MIDLAKIGQDLAKTIREEGGPDMFLALNPKFPTQGSAPAPGTDRAEALHSLVAGLLGYTQPTKLSLAPEGWAMIPSAAFAVVERPDGWNFVFTRQGRGQMWRNGALNAFGGTNAWSYGVDPLVILTKEIERKMGIMPFSTIVEVITASEVRNAYKVADNRFETFFVRATGYVIPTTEAEIEELNATFQSKLAAMSKAGEDPWVGEIVERPVAEFLENFGTHKGPPNDVVQVAAMIALCVQKVDQVKALLGDTAADPKVLWLVAKALAMREYEKMLADRDPTAPLVELSTLFD